MRRGKFYCISFYKNAALCLSAQCLLLWTVDQSFCGSKVALIIVINSKKKTPFCVGIFTFAVIISSQISKSFYLTNFIITYFSHLQLFCYPDKSQWVER